MIFNSRVTLLQDEIKYLHEKLEKSEQRNHELSLAIINSLKKPEPIAAVTAPQKAPVKHSVLIDNETKAHCPCGWTFTSTDPAVLQNAISSHYRSGIIPAKPQTWAQKRDRLESVAELEAATKEKAS